jgi:hydroxymethylpyrimidine/phosphomethylpyrimidine kinase
MAARRIPAVLSIAGSDSGGGAGIQADLKAFARCGVHGMTAITALTAQNTVGVTRVEPVSHEMIVAQVKALVDDIGVDAVKIGMLGDEPTIAAVDEALGLVGDVPIVVDPVMVSASGSVLLAPEARAALVERILPRATVATPNVLEARELAGMPDEDDQARLAAAVRELGPKAVIVTGGHATEGDDLLLDDEGALRISGERHPEGGAHGSGCTHSSALAAFLARGLPLREAARRAREVASEAVGQGLRDIGAGPGPVDALGVARRT